MRFRSPSLFALTALLAILTLVPISPGAVPHAFGSAAFQQAKAGNVTVCFVIDTSGSMKTNDSTNLRFTAAKLFISLLDPGDSVCIDVFSTGSDLRAPLTKINGHEDKVALMSKLDNIAAEGNTDMLSAFRDVAPAINADKSGNQRALIFLTDGLPNPSGSGSGQLPPNYLTDTIKYAKDANAPLLSIALTTEGESPFLFNLTQAVGGESKVFSAKTPTDILDRYLSILGSLRDRTIFGEGEVQAPGNASLLIQTELEPYIKSVSFVAAHDDKAQVSFVSPQGAVLQANDPRISETFSDPRFTVYTINAPVTGNWTARFNGSAKGQARGILRSRLRVLILEPRGFVQAGKGMPIIARMLETDDNGNERVIVGEAQYPGPRINAPDTGYTLDKLYDDGTHGDLKAGDGDFSNTFVNTGAPGEYTVRISGRKGDLKLNDVSTTVRVVQFPSLVLDAPQRGSVEASGPISITAHLEGGDPPALDSGELVASIDAPGGPMPEVVLSELGGGRYGGSFTPSKRGDYTITIRMRNAKYKGSAHSGEASVKVAITPHYRILVKTTNLDVGTNDTLSDGQSRSVTISSESDAPETVDVALSGLAGGSVSPSSFTVQPGENTVVLTISSKSELPVGNCGSTLIFSSRNQAITIANPQIQVACIIGPASITLEPAQIKVEASEGSTSEFVVSLRATSTSGRNETLTVASITPPDLRVDRMEPATLPPGEATDLKLHLSPTQGLSSGDHRIAIKLNRPRPTLVVEPDTIVLDVHVPNFWERFGLWIILLLLLLVALLFGLCAITPVPRGSLVGTNAPDGAAPVTYRFSRYIPPCPLRTFKNKVRIGRGAGNDIKLADSTVAAQHALVKGERRSKPRPGARSGQSKRRPATVLYCTARGNTCSVNGSTVPPGGVILEHGNTVQIGSYTFEYR